jgi:hypothetical protein
VTTPPPVVHVFDALVEVKRRRDAAKVSGNRPIPSATESTGDPVVITDPVAYVEATMRRLVTGLAGTTTGGRNAATHEAARTVGRMVGAGLPLDPTTACVELLDACRANGLVGDDGEHAAKASIRSGYAWGHEHPLAWVQSTTPGPAIPLDVPDDVWRQANPAIGNGVVDLDALEALRAQLTAAEVEKERARRAARRTLDLEESAAQFVRVALKRGDTFLAEPDPPITWAIADLAQVGHNVLLTAQYKTGKTTFLLNLARAVADGVRFLDHFDTSLDLGNIAMLDYELGEAQYRRWLREVGVGQVGKVLVGHWRGVRGRFDDERNVADLIDQFGTAGIGVAVIDPFAAAAKGVDENDNGAVGAFLNLIDHVKRQAGVHTVVLATHTGRRDAEIGHERARGATRLDDWPDVRWLLTKGKDDDAETRYFAADGRDVTVPPGALDYDETLRRYRYTGNTPGIMRARALDERVLDAVHDTPGINITALRKTVGGKGEYVDRSIDNLARRGYVVVTGGEPGKPKAIRPGRARHAATPFDPEINPVP